MHNRSIPLPAPAPAGARKGDPHKKAILVISFGTSFAHDRDAAIGAIEREIQAAHPGWEVRRAFTSQMILAKLRKRDGVQIDNICEAMDRLVAEGFGTLAVQPTHVMNGMEYDEMVSILNLYRNYFAGFAVGAPLLTSTADYQELVSAVCADYPGADGSALVLMGHGSKHFANCAYAALSYHFLECGRGDILVGTVEGYPDLDAVLRAFGPLGVRRVTLAPLMVVAGEHAQNDMAGPEPDSWKSIFEARGCEVSCVLKGMGESPRIRAQYAAHAAEAVRRTEQQLERNSNRCS